MRALSRPLTRPFTLGYTGYAGTARGPARERAAAGPGSSSLARASASASPAVFGPEHPVSGRRGRLPSHAGDQPHPRPGVR
eukprot:4632673-Alexandrium_andersonii.AAC.1